jgi:hypothetical protein
MNRPLAIAAAVLGMVCCSAAAFAQIDPNDPLGLGVKRGMSQQNNSGQAGTVTLFRRGKNTLVVLDVASVPHGRTEPAHLHRGHSCDTLDPSPAYGLAPVVNGVSRTLVHASEDKLLSGNYVVNVHSSAQNLGRYVSCGELYK